MRTLHVEVVGSAEALKRFSRAWKKASRGREADATIGLASISELMALLSPKRMELLHHVAGCPGLSIKALAEALGRDYKNVHTDVSELEERHFLERDGRGRVISPYEVLIIRVPLSRAA